MALQVRTHRIRLDTNRLIGIRLADTVEQWHECIDDIILHLRSPRTSIANDHNGDNGTYVNVVGCSNCEMSNCAIRVTIS